MTATDTALDFVQYIVKTVCGDGEFSVEIVEDDRGKLILIKANGEVIGKLIGRAGKTISALRTLTTNITARDGERVALKLEEIE